MNDSELVSDLQDRKPDAFRRLCDLHMSSLWRYVYWRVGRNQHLAEDIISETLLALVESVHLLDPSTSNLGAWLRVVANSKVIDHQRSIARVWRLLHESSRNGHAKRSEAPPEMLEQKERAERVWKVLGELSEQHRQALEWKYLDRLSVRTIAHRWSMTEKSVESILYRARNDFRTRFEKEEVPEKAIPPGEDADRSAGEFVSATKCQKAIVPGWEDEALPSRRPRSTRQGPAGTE